MLEFNLTWFEEPIPYHDHGEADRGGARAMPVASGETEYTSRGMFEMARQRSADILMPDLQRMGGPTEFLKAAHIAEAFNIPVSLHLFPEMSPRAAGRGAERDLSRVHAVVRARLPGAHHARRARSRCRAGSVRLGIWL